MIISDPITSEGRQINAEVVCNRIEGGELTITEQLISIVQTHEYAAEINEIISKPNPFV